MLFEPHVRFHSFNDKFGNYCGSLLGNSCLHGLRYVLSKYKYLIVNLGFSRFGFGVGISF